MASRADIYRGRAHQCEARIAAATDPKTQISQSQLARRWHELARQLDMMDEDYSPEIPKQPAYQ
jgi:hypothetical protein